MVLISCWLCEQSNFCSKLRWYNVNLWIDSELKAALSKSRSIHGWRTSHGSSWWKNKFNRHSFLIAFWTAMTTETRYLPQVRTKTKPKTNFFYVEKVSKIFSRDTATWQTNLNRIKKRFWQKEIWRQRQIPITRTSMRSNRVETNSKSRQITSLNSSDQIKQFHHKGIFRRNDSINIFHIQFTFLSVKWNKIFIFII